jgi:hypothetical protein
MEGQLERFLCSGGLPFDKRKQGVVQSCTMGCEKVLKDTV